MPFPWTPKEMSREVERAVASYWSVRSGQASRQLDGGTTDAGRRGEVTGGLHMDGFADLVTALVLAAGFKLDEIRLKSNVELPGYYRSTKKWDLVVARAGRLCCAIELKSQVGPSFGNNFNNRTEEAIGTSVDIWKAYEKGLIGVAQPWIGYVFLLQDDERSRQPVRVASTLFQTDPIFDGASYAKRYEILCTRIVLERHYSAATLLLSERGSTGAFSEPSLDLSFARFAHSLYGHLVGCA